MRSVKLAADGSCLNNPGPGGWASLLTANDGMMLELSGTPATEFMVSGYSEDTTNNRMELLAVLSGLRALPEPTEVHILVDSKYVMDGFEKGWINGWKRNGWRTADKKPVKNQDLWQSLDAEVARHKVRWEWVRGHTGHPENERVDKEANKQAIHARNCLGNKNDTGQAC